MRERCGEPCETAGPGYKVCAAAARLHFDMPGLPNCHEYRQNKTAMSTEQRKTPSPAEIRVAEGEALAIGLDHANRRQPSPRHDSYSFGVSLQLHQRKTRNCGLAHLRRDAATKHEGRVFNVGVREGWPCFGCTPSTPPPQRVVQLLAGCCCTSVP
jgi:hypothetical protein